MLAFVVSDTTRTMSVEVGLFFTGAGVRAKVVGDIVERLRAALMAAFARASRPFPRILIEAFDGEHHSCLVRAPDGGAAMFTQKLRVETQEIAAELAPLRHPDLFTMAREMGIPVMQTEGGTERHIPLGVVRGNVRSARIINKLKSDGVLDGDGKVAKVWWPTTDSDGVVRLGVEDAPHLLKRIRFALLRCVERKEKWLGHDAQVFVDIAKNAHEHSTTLTPALMAGADKQSVSNARRTFSPSVESRLRELGEEGAADAVRVVHRWWGAVDERGLSASERISRARDMRSLLMGFVDMAAWCVSGSVPSQVGGLSIETFEGLLAHCGAMELLAEDSEVGGSFNVRSLSTDDLETLFSMTEAMFGRPTVLQAMQWWRIVCLEKEKRLDPHLPYSYWTTNVGRKRKSREDARLEAEGESGGVKQARLGPREFHRDSGRL